MKTRARRGAVWSRRNVIVAAGGAAGAVLVSACGGEVSETSGDGDPTDTVERGTELAALDDVPVGGAISVELPGGEPVIVARPTEDTVVAFSAICTHQGCTVKPEATEIRCPCHGSTYDLAGENTGGPAPSPLPPVDVTVADGLVVMG